MKACKKSYFTQVPQLSSALSGVSGGSSKTEAALDPGKEDLPFNFTLRLEPRDRLEPLDPTEAPDRDLVMPDEPAEFLEFLDPLDFLDPFLEPFVGTDRLLPVPALLAGD